RRRASPDTVCMTAPGPGSGVPPLRAGVREDFDLLYRQSYTRVRYALQAVLRDPAAAEDCAQEAFVKALGAWHSWKGEAPAEAWLLRIAFNGATSYRRRASGDRSSLSSLPDRR